ncbi:hypothetical protein [Xenorhabdus littoralis]|uniref:hypothetical protein n=1 Tax=Xenorhabdus littoralis TaxID=2582835 RepID=UPI0029E8131A|nr:hypothetical protein [Xenorhabdus sp. psl]MDX7990281.1 hypothetical protein [Xenorhabdus sp. psl]
MKNSDSDSDSDKSDIEVSGFVLTRQSDSMVRADTPNKYSSDVEEYSIFELPGTSTDFVLMNRTEKGKNIPTMTGKGYELKIVDKNNQNPHLLLTYKELREILEGNFKEDNVGDDNFMVKETIKLIIRMNETGIRKGIESVRYLSNKLKDEATDSPGRSPIVVNRLKGADNTLKIFKPLVPLVSKLPEPIATTAKVAEWVLNFADSTVKGASAHDNFTSGTKYFEKYNQFPFTNERKQTLLKIFEEKIKEHKQRKGLLSLDKSKYIGIMFEHPDDNKKCIFPMYVKSDEAVNIIAGYYYNDHIKRASEYKGNFKVKVRPKKE